MKRILLLVSSAFLVSCATPPALSLTDIDKPTPLAGVAPAPIVCPPDLEQRVEETRQMGLKMEYETGKVFRKAFIGTRTDQPRIELVESTLSASIADLGFTGVFSYRATIRLHSSSGVFELRAECTRKVHGFEMPPTSVKIVVETVVADLLQQSKAHLSS